MFTGSIPYSTQTCGFKNIWSRHLVKQLWPPDGCRRTERRLSTTLAAKGFVLLSTQQEGSFKWIDPSEWLLREEWWTSRESLVASYRYLGVSNPGLQMIRSNECDVSYQYGTRASFQYIRRIPALYILRPKKLLCGWNLVNALLSMNEACMDECASRLQPLVDQ